MPMTWCSRPAIARVQNLSYRNSVSSQVREPIHAAPRLAHEGEAINLGDLDARSLVSRSPAENARLLARGELPVGRADLSAGQSSAGIAAHARTYQAPFARALGHDDRIELSLC